MPSRIRSILATLGALLAFSGAASLVHAGPGLERRTLAGSHDDTRAGALARSIAREASALLEPLIGRTPVASVELVPDPERFAALAREVDEPDETVFADFSRHAVVLLGTSVDLERGRLLVHEAAKLALHAGLGHRPAPWLEEGLACCVEDAWLQGAELGAEAPDMDRLARARFERPSSSAGRLLALAPAAFERGERVHRDVALAWSATRRLLHGSDGARATLVARLDDAPR